MSSITLYKRNAQGKIIMWKATTNGESQVMVHYGAFRGTLRSESYTNMKRGAEAEFTSRVNAKRKEGYKSLSDLKDNAPEYIAGLYDLGQYLDTYLPKDNTDLKGDKFCMLAKTLEDDKPFIKNFYFGQWKINGERCLIGAIKTNDMFAPIKLTYTSRIGTDWTPTLQWMDEIILPCLKTSLLDMMLETGARLDGELYLPGYAISDINHIIKNPNAVEHKNLQYWCYDIAIDNMSAQLRNTIIMNSVSYIISVNSKEEHLNNKQQFVALPYEHIPNFNAAMNARDKYINLGFEGLIVRNADAEYQFGKRNLSMLKYKKIYDGWFDIIAIEPQSKKDNLPLFILKNDINSETFECTFNGSHILQSGILVDKHNYIGTKAFVEYRERSGVKEVPFHAKIVRLEVIENMNKRALKNIQAVTEKSKTINKKIKLKL